MPYRVFSIFFGFIFFSFLSLTAKDSVRLETLRGAEIAPHIREIVDLCGMIYSEYPYLYNGEDVDYTSYLESYAESNDAVICFAFDGDKAIGFAAGIPMSKSRDLYKQTLLENGYDIDALFYLGEFGLKPEYRWHGIEEAMYQEIENYARKGGCFETICIWEIDDTINTQQKPPGYISKDRLWNKLGLVQRPLLHFQMFWTNINDTMESPHLAVYWTKNL